jgi:hypothetical protein
VSSILLDARSNLFNAVLGRGRGSASHLASHASRPGVLITDDGIELILVTSADGQWSYGKSLDYRNFKLSYAQDSEPTRFSKGYKWTLSGGACGREDTISNAEAETLICDIASERGLPCDPDSESGQLFIHVPTYEIARALVDIAHDLGLCETPSS